jgi:hypothetical protein
MHAARGVGLHVGECGRGVDRAVPDEAIAPAAGSEVAKGAGHRIAEDVLAVEEAPSEAVEDSGMGRGREPGDAAGVDQIKWMSERETDKGTRQEFRLGADRRQAGRSASARSAQMRYAWAQGRRRSTAAAAASTSASA